MALDYMSSTTQFTVTITSTYFTIFKHTYMYKIQKQELGLDLLTYTGLIFIYTFCVYSV